MSVVIEKTNAFAEGTLVQRMLRIALPLTLSGIVRYTVELSNMYWVGKLGVVALSIVTALGTFMSLSRMFAGFTSAGTSAVIGRMMGEARERDALRTAQKVAAVALVLGASIGVLAVLASEPALRTLQFTGPHHDDAARHLYVLIAGLPFSFGYTTVTAALVGLGHPRAAMRASMAALVVGSLSTPILLRVLHTGVWGAGIAQVAGDIAGYSMGFVAIRELSKTRYRVLSWHERLTRLRDLLPVVRIGAPLTLDSVVHGTVWFALVAFLARYGSEYVAAQGTEERFTQILNIPTEGIAPAAATLVGFHLGRGERPEALRVVKYALAMVFVASLTGALILRLMPTPVVAWLCSDPSFVDVGLKVLAIAAIGLVFLATRDVMEASFGGVGHAVPPVLIGLVVALMRFPLAYLVAVRGGYGGLGVSWAVNGTLVLQAVILVVWFRVRFDRYGGIEVEKLAESVIPPPTSAADLEAERTRGIG